MRTNARRGSAAVTAIFSVWLCCQLFDPKEDAAHDDAEPVTPAQPKTRFPLDLTPKLQREPTRLTGHVLDGQHGVANAWVCASCVACEATSAAASPCTRSQSDGAYAFADLPAAGYFIAASAVGYAPGAAHGGGAIFIRAGELRNGVDIALMKGGARVSGSVVDATGGPISHAHVRAIRLQPPRLSIDVVTDAAGQFELWVNPGYIELSAESEGYARAIQRTTAPTDVELRLVPGSSIEGVVVNALDQRPVAGVDVRAAPPENPQLAMARGSVSDDSGRFRVEGLEPGAYLLSARAEGLLGMPAESIELGVAEQRSGVVVEVTPAAAVSGRVLFSGDKLPCREGFVALGQRSPLEAAPTAEDLAGFGATLESITTAIGPEQVADIRADGSVHFPGVPPGFYFVNVQCVSSRLERGPRLLRVTHEPLAELEWSVAKGGELRVHVVDERGAGISEMQVMVEHPTPESQVVQALETNSDGRCSVDGLAPGTYRVYVASQPAETLVSLELKAAGNAETTLRLVHSAMIVVEASDARGQPIDGLSINATQRAAAPPERARDSQRWNALPLGAGRYRIGPVPGGSYVITADDGVNPSPPDPAVVVAAAGGTTQARIVLARDGVISGRVIDEQKGAVPDVWVSAKPQLNTRDASGMHTFALTEARQQRVLTDRDGRFRLVHLDPGALFDVRALTPYGTAAVRRGVRPGPELTIELPEAASISGIALDERGKPIAPLMATAISRDSDSKQTRRFFDPSGRFTLPTVAPGAVELSLVSADGRSATSTLQVAAGARVTGLALELVAPPAL